jgi:hypothetical protein
MTRKYNQGVADSNRRRTKHGGAVGAREGNSDKLYGLWTGIKQRCTNPNALHYARYGGRGITMHPTWVDDFAQFRADVGDPSEPGLTLDRVDNAGNYEPSNVRWATRKEQANNRVTNVVLTHAGETMTLKQWSEKLGQKYGLMASRWKAGLRGEELFAPPKNKRDTEVTFGDKTQTLRAWANETGVPYWTLYWRVKNGKPLLKG